MEELATGYGLIEGPTWDPSRGLIFSDVTNGGVFCLSSDGSIDTIVPHRKGMGGIALHASGGLVVSGRNVAWKPAEGGTIVLLEADQSREELGFNDLTADTAGRIYVGSIAFQPVVEGSEPKPGALYMIDVDGTVTLEQPDIELTNGLGLSPDGTVLYHSDTFTHAVWAFDVAEDGHLSNRRVHGNLGDTGRPDGLAVAIDGTVYVADAALGRVAVFAADGAALPDIPVPLPMVTSVCFGGDNLGDLYIVTGSRDAGRENAGTIYRMKAEVPGVPIAKARVGS